MEGWWAPLTPTASPLPPTRVPPPPATPRCHCRPLSNSYNVLPRYDGWTDAEDVDSTVEILRDRELRSLHRMVPALKRRELDTRAIKSHFYPEGGWGWIVCGAAFLAHLLSTGLQLAYGGLHVYAIKHLGPAGNHAVWAGAICVGVSRVVGAMVSVRRQGPRVIAVIGGVILPLACLFTSFATQLHQVLLSYGVVLGIGCALVREAAGLVLGAYFRKRRQFVELVAHAGAGVGIALFSVAFKEALGKLGWRLGLQAITGALMTAFFLSTVYRSATLYHPQRPAILHLKNQRRKVKEKRPKSRKPFFDFTPLRSRPACMLFMAVGVAAFGLYTPVFFLASQGLQEGLEESALVLLQTFLGFATVLGTAGFGLVLVRPSTQCLISKQYLCQTAMLGLGISTLALSSIEEYHGYMLFSWMYGLCLGGFLYSIKMLTMERVRGKHFAKVWGFVQGAEAIPVIVGIPVTGYINEQNAKTGFYFSTAATLAGALLLSFVGFSKRESDHTIPPTVQTPIAEVCPCLSPQFHREPSWCGCSVGGTTAYCTWQRNCNKLPKSLSYAAPLNRPCCPSVYCRDCYLRPYSVPLRSSRSVPEGLAQRNNTWSRGGSCRMPCRRREHQLIEQITTSV